MEFVTAAFNVVLVVFIASTMLAAGLGTPIDQLVDVLRRGGLLLLVLAANLVVVPLLGWGVAAAFGLSTAGTIALLLVASSPGAPFGAKLAMLQRGDVLTGSTLQVLLGSRTLLAAAVFTLLSAVAGGVLATGPNIRRTTVAGIAPLRNAGPAFAAVAIAFDSDPEIVAALSGILLTGLVVTVPVAARLAADRPVPDRSGAQP
jgi:hypothetical protein